MDRPETSHSNSQTGEHWTRRWRWTALLTLPACVLIALAIGAGRDHGAPPLYEAVARVKVNAGGDARQMPDWNAWNLLADQRWLQVQADELELAEAWNCTPRDAAERPLALG